MDATTDTDHDQYDRQVRAFGGAGQAALRSLTVAVVGVGGAGSLFVEGLSHLGVGRLILVDHDRLETTNMNRVVGASPPDAAARLPKVDVATRLAHRIDPLLEVTAHNASILTAPTWRALREADVLIGAVDSDAARWALNQVAVQYARFYLDVGVEITKASDAIEVAGHVAAVRPNGPCLRCLHGYDPTHAARELQPDLRRTKVEGGYLQDVSDEPSPSVIFLNQAVVSFALAELMNWVAPWKRPTPYLLLDMGAPNVMAIDADPDPACPVCGTSGVRGMGDLAGIPRFDPTPSTAPPLAANTTAETAH